MENKRDRSACSRYLADLAAYADGELPAARAAEVAAHIESCPACGREAARLASAWALLGDTAEAQPPEDLRRKVWAEVLEARPAHGSRRANRWKLATLLASLMVVLSVTSATCRMNMRSADASLRVILDASPEEIAVADDATALENLDFLIQCDILDDPKLLATIESL